jgi:hypothetical protein
VGGYLDFRSLTAIPDGFNPTVGGSLYLRSLTAIPDGFNPTVGGSLDFRSGLTCNFTPPNPETISRIKNRLISWCDGRFILADNILTEVVSKKGNIYTVKKLNDDKIFYLVSNGFNHAHGETIEKAKEDYKFKLIAEKLKNDPISADTIITIRYYRTITGACEIGVNNWIDSVFDQNQKKTILKKGIKAKDLLPILQKNNAYGFEKFKSLVNF